jgi:hypothetical protein
VDQQGPLLHADQLGEGEKDFIGKMVLLCPRRRPTELQAGWLNDIHKRIYRKEPSQKAVGWR